MRVVMTTLGLAMVLAACESQKAAPELPKPMPVNQVGQPLARPTAQPGEAASQPAGQMATAPGAPGVKGKVLEKIDAAGYTYLRLQTASGEQWAAVTQTNTAVGADVEIVDSTPMHNFESKTLNRKFETILFGSLKEGGAAGGAEAAGQAGQQQLPPGHPPMNAPSQAVGDVKVDKATGPNAKTVAEVWADRAKLANTKVTVRGKVVKVSNGVMDKNWLHLRDGSGSDAAKDNDLTVTSASGTAAIGDVVTIEGVVHTDKDFGAGYSYSVIVEEATVQK